jgi:hypothetical protein
MTGERAFCSGLKRKVSTDLNPPATSVNVTAPGSSRDNVGQRRLICLSMIIG